MNRRQFFGAAVGATAIATLPAAAPVHPLADRPFVVFAETVSFEEFKRRWPVSAVRLARAMMTDVERTESMLRAEQRRDIAFLEGEKWR